MRPPLRSLTSLLLFALAALCSSGCVYTAYNGPAKQGETAPSLKRISLFGNQTVGKVDLVKGTLEGYASEQAEIAGAIAAGITKGLAKP